MVPKTNSGADKAHPVSKMEDVRDHTHHLWQPVGAVECSECEQTKQSGGRLKLRDAGEVKPHYDRLVCENCKSDLLNDEPIQADDTIEVTALTEELFAGEIDTVADEYDVPRDELAKVIASDLGFWIPTENSYVDDDVVIVLGTHKELSVPDTYRDAVQRVHNRAAVRITADSDWDVAERREVYVAPRELRGR